MKTNQNINSGMTGEEKHNIEVEPIRIDEITSKRFTFTSDPDNLPIEFYEK